MFVLGWGVAGAALATTASQYASFAVMYYLMLKKGILQQKHMQTVPRLDQVLPILQVNPIPPGLCEQSLLFHHPQLQPLISFEPLRIVLAYKL